MPNVNYRWLVGLVRFSLDRWAKFVCLVEFCLRIFRTIEVFEQLSVKPQIFSQSTAIARCQTCGICFCPDNSFSLVILARRQIVISICKIAGQCFKFAED